MHEIATSKQDGVTTAIRKRQRKMMSDDERVIRKQHDSR